MCQFVSPERLLFTRFPADVDAASLVPSGAVEPHVAPQELVKMCGEQTQDAQKLPLPAWERMCLLDMEAKEPLQPEDVDSFDAFVFGGILGNCFEREDGSYGSDDRTAEIRKHGFLHRRHLGPLQMTTDTAILTCHLVLDEKQSLAEIPFIDSPDIGGSASDGGTGSGEGIASDCVCMEGFRYVAQRGAGGEWEPRLPQGMREFLMKDADNNILDSL